jgi:hypothetical protein
MTVFIVTFSGWCVSEKVNQQPMNIRPFDWRDLPLLHRYRQRGLFLDSARAFTRGTVLIPAGALLAYFAPATGIFTYLSESEGEAHQPLVGQVFHASGSPFAQLTFLAPEAALQSAALPALFDYIAVEMGQRGAFYVLAEVDENSQAFLALHLSGFAVYARQRIWRLAGEPQGQAEPTWRVCTPKDTLGVRVLYAGLVPGLVQQVEPLPRERLKGMVFTLRGEIRGYVELRYGRFGIWAQPFVHPDAPDVAGRLVHLLQALPNRRGRMVYLCVRSYQSWLESAIECIGAQPGQSQAVMVRHLAVARKATQPYAIPARNGARAEPVARINDYPKSP